MIDAMGLGPVTVGRAAYDGAFANERSLILLSNAVARRRRWRDSPTLRPGPRRQYVDEQVGGIDQLLAIFYVLLALAVIVSLFGIVNTLVLATFERTQELGTLRAVGMTRRQVRRMVRHESVITALIGAVLGMASASASPPRSPRRSPTRA